MHRRKLTSDPEGTGRRLLRSVKKRIEDNTQPINMSTDEIQQITNRPLLNALYRAQEVPPALQTTKKNYKDRMKCELCGRTVARSARSRHRESEFHKAYESFNTKLKRAILGE